jgi:hypothetical protein
MAPEPEGSSLYSQEPATGPYPELFQRITYTPYNNKINFTLHLNIQLQPQPLCCSKGELYLSNTFKKRIPIFVT